MRALPRPARAHQARPRAARLRGIAPRAALLAAALPALALVLGCQESGFDERKETARPLKVQHVLGETKVPGQAEEPLTLTLDALDDTLALGVRPARAAVRNARLPAYLRQPAAGVSLMRPVTAADLAAVQAVQADLIIGADSAQGRLYDDLSRIAPTVMIEGGGGQWKLNMRLVGEALGRTNDAEQLLTDYDRRAARVREAIRRARGGAADGEAGGESGDESGRDGGQPRVAIARLTANGLRFAPRDSFAGTILADVGVTQVTRNSPEARVDVVLLSRAPGSKPGPAPRPQARGRIARVDDALWSGPGGALAAREALEDLANALAR